MNLLGRAVVPSRLALIFRAGETLGYNPTFNTWHRLDEATAETLRWLRARRAPNDLPSHLARRFGYRVDTAGSELQRILRWCVLRRLLYIDQEPEAPKLVPSPAPLAVVYWISTQACNLRCTYCYQDAKVARPRELSTAEARGLVDQVLDAGAAAFVITGGEPFSRRDLLDVASYSKSRGLRTNVITNGHFIQARNISAVAETFDLVTISLDHGIPEHHDRHRGQGSWKHAVDAIDLLVNAGVSVDVNSVLSRLGLRDVDELFQFVASRRIGQHRVTPQFPMGRGASARDHELTPDEILELSDRIHSAISRSEHGRGPNVKTEGEYSKKGQLRSHCGAGLSEVSVDPEGWVYPCKLLQYSQFRAQNIRDAPLKAIYDNNVMLQNIRSSTTENLQPCRTCIIKNHCGGGCRGIQFSFTNEYIKANPLFCAYLRRSFEVQAWGSTGTVPPARPKHFHQEEHIGKAPEQAFIPISSLMASTT